jgi:solute carrier family 20 (sodium-dependent phosphate transporter)
MVYYPQYLWIAVVGGFVGFLYAFGIGANDVANAFASTVASKSLTLKQAIIAAGIFEFCGAFFLGANVTNTIRSKIFSVDLYKGQEDIVMLGMFTSLITSTFMLFVATYFGLPVSTTHTIVGAIMGFSICAKGFGSINGTVAGQIFLSWILSPCVSLIVAFCFFGFIKIFIHGSSNPYMRAYYLFPLILTIFIGIDLFFILYKGVTQNYKLSLSLILPVSFGTGAACGVIWLLIIGPIAKRRVTEKMARDAEAKAAKDEENQAADEKPEQNAKAAADEEVEDGEEEYSADEFPVKTSVKTSTAVTVTKTESVSAAPAEPTELAEAESGQKKSFRETMASAGATFAANTYGQDLKAQSLHENAEAAHLWEDAEQFDMPTEQMFTYVQVFTACLNSFAHGANDVSNAIAPISAIILIYQTGELSSKASVQKWILAYGGIGIVAGLLIYGYRVMKSVGYKLAALSPSRGASAELAASLYVVTASYLEIPVSSTQCIVGAVAGVGLTSGFKAVGWWFFLRVCVGWVVVFFSAVILSAGAFCFVAFSPSLY